MSIYLPGGRRPIWGGVSKGWCLNYAGTYFAQAANNGVHDVTTQDIGFAAWIKLSASHNDWGYIFNKRGGTDGYQVAIAGNGILYVGLYDGGNTYTIAGTTDFRNGHWNHLACVIDRNNAGNCKVYVNGVDDTNSKTGVLGNIVSLTSTDILISGHKFGRFLNGWIAELAVTYPADIMSANEMGASGEIAALYANFRNPAAWCNLEDYWECDDGSGTTVTGSVNDLTATNAAIWKKIQLPS